MAKMVWHDDVKKTEQVRDKIIVAEIQRRAHSAVQTGQDRYYQPHGQDAEANIER